MSYWSWLVLPSADRLTQSPQRKLRTLWAAGSSAVLLALVCPWSAAGADPNPEAGEALELLSPASTEITVPLREVPASDPAAAREKTGQLRLLLRSTSDADGTLKLKYFGGPPESESVVSLPAPEPLRAGETTAVAIGFAVPADEPPSAIDGTLIATLRSKGSAGSAPLVLQISGEPAALTGVELAPAALTLRPERWFDFLGHEHTTGDSAAIRLRGPGVGAALEDPLGPLSTVLHSADGYSLTVTMTTPKLIGPNEAEAEVEIDQAPHPGTYEGDLPLTSFGTAPKLAVTVISRDLLAWAIFFVFAGSVLGGYFLPRYRLKRRKARLRDDLSQAVDRYEDERGDYDDKTKQRTTPPKSWSLDSLLGTGHLEAGWETRPPGIPDYAGALGLYWEIRDDITAEDVERNRLRVVAIVDAIGRWLAVERAAKALAKEIVGRKPVRIQDSPFIETKAWSTTKLLLIRMRRPPDEAAKVDDLADLLDRQLQIFKLFCDLWTAKGALALPERPPMSAGLAAAINRYSTADLDGVFPDAEVPTLDEYDQILLHLSAKWESLVSEDGDVAAMVKEVESRASTIPTEEEGIRFTLDAASAPIAIEFAAAPELAMQLASPAGPASVSGEDRAAAPTGDQAKAPAPRRRLVSGRLDLTRRRDLVWTFVGAAVGVIVYTVGIYDDTWGSLVDYLTAFGTGFMSSTIVKWADLPALESLNRRTPVGAAAATNPPE